MAGEEVRRPPTCTAVVLLAYAALAYAAYPVLPPSFTKPLRSNYSSRGEVRVNVRVVPHPDIRTLRLEAWVLEAVQWGPTLAHMPEASTEQAPEGDLVRWEPRECIRASDEPLEYPPFLDGETDKQWRDRVNPRTLHEFNWRTSLAPGHYELKLKVITKRNISVSATHRIQVS